jgi:amino-acid N-acetyltransferase
MIRPAKVTDAPTLQQLINHYAKKELMLARSLHEIYDSLRDFSVYEQNNDIAGACALHICWQDLAEIRSLAVDERQLKQGIGSQLIAYKLQEAKALGISRVFALTYNVEFFKQHAFRVIEKSLLPHKIWADCIKCIHFPDCNETAMVYHLDSR